MLVIVRARSSTQCVYRTRAGTWQWEGRGADHWLGWRALPSRATSCLGTNLDIHPSKHHHKRICRASSRGDRTGVSA